MFPKFLNPIEASSIFEIVIGAAVALIWWPLAFLAYCLNVTLRFFSQLACDHYYPGRFRIACGEDSVFGVKLRGSCKSYIHGYKVIRGEPDLELIRSKFRELFTKTDGYDKMKYAMTHRFGYFCWDTKVPFDINSHIRLLDDFDPEEIVDETKLADICSRLTLKNCEGDDAKPQWEIFLIPKYKMNGEFLDGTKTSHFALVIRIHHAYCDGISFVLMINNFLSDTPGELPIDPSKGFNNPIWIKAYIWMKIIVIGPFKFLKSLAMLVFTPNNFRVDRYVNSKVMAKSSPISMDTLRKIRTASGTSVTSITLSVVYAALHKTHLRLFPGKPLPKKTHLGSVGVMLPYLEEKRLVNQFTMWPYTAPLEVSDPKTRLALTYEEVRKCASQPDPLFNFYMQRALGSLNVIWHKILFSLSGTPIMLSNVPGYKTPVKLFGGELVDAACWIPLVTTTGIGLSSQSYCGKIHFSAVADPQLFATAARLKEFLEEIIEEIHILADEFNIDCNDNHEVKGALKGTENGFHAVPSKKDDNDNEEPMVTGSSLQMSGVDCRNRKKLNTNISPRNEKIQTTTSHTAEGCDEKRI